MAIFHLPINRKMSPVETLLISMRFVQFVAAMTLFGSSLFPLYALPHNGKHPDLFTFLQKTAFVASLAALLSAVVWLGCEAVLMSGDANGYRESSTILTVLDHTQFGRIWRWRLLLLAVLPLFLAWNIFSRRAPFIWPILFSGLVLVISLAGIGHGAMGVGADAWIHLFNQAVHLMAASVWVGGLLSLYFVIRTARNSGRKVEMLTHTLKRFSTFGLCAVLLILASGFLNSRFLVGSWRALLHTAYGHVLMIKLLFFVGMIALALCNRLYFMPRLLHKPRGAETLHLLLRSVAVEQGCAILVVASVSVLGTLTPAFDMAGMNM